MRIRPVLPVLFVLALLAACSGGDGPFLEVEGGGFIFNYRIAETTAGLVARPLRKLPAGSRVEASFENPAGGGPIVLQQPATEVQEKYVFTTPALTGVVKDRPYQVTVTLVGAGGDVLQTVALTFRSNVDQSIMPEAPLVVGPGYQRPGEAPGGN